MPTVSQISPAVRAALAAGRPVVALESTIISHGLPRPANLAAARSFEEMDVAYGSIALAGEIATAWSARKKEARS
jgi:pseudouridine-5'-phosphate glycosidase